MMNQKAKKFLEKYKQEIIPLYTKASVVYFNAKISGKSEDYKKAEELDLEVTKHFSNKMKFEEAKEILKDNSLNLEEKRVFQLIHRQYLREQIDPELLEKIIRSQSAIEKKFNTSRAVIDGIEYTDNQIEEILSNSKDSEMVKKAWLASKKIGEGVSDKILELVKIRNEAAKELGYENYHHMSLALSEQSVSEIEKLFDEAEQIFQKEYKEIKEKEIDQALAKKFNIAVDQLYPWHFQNRFFQEAPRIYDVNLDSLYEDKNSVEITQNYYHKIGLDIEKSLAKSDLYEKPGKYQHACCIDIDRDENDVRVICNLKSNQKWMDTILHEFGHAVYQLYLDQKLHWVLKRAAHIFVTEAIAIFFGRLASDANWIKNNVGKELSKEEAEASRKQIRLEKIVFSRWCQVMFRFEKAMYENPDQNLNDLWWNLVERYQSLRRPEDWDRPFWASKIHIASSPAYYHNYLLGDFLASQIKAKLKKEGIDFSGSDPQLGQYLREEFFQYGAQYRWDDLVERATGEKLSPKAFAEEFLN